MDFDTLTDDARAEAIFMEVFNPEDDMYDPDRDENRLNDCVAKIVALGYSEEDARAYMQQCIDDVTNDAEAEVDA